MARQQAGPETTVATSCPYCGVGCGVLAKVNSQDQSVSVSGDPDHPANFGRLCSKGSALHETLSVQDRVLTPSVDSKEVTWDKAISHVADRFRTCIEQHGPDSVAFYVSGQLLTEDYYVANKLMKGFIGSANIDTNSRLCMASSVAGHKRAFGTDTVPGCYEDLELGDLIVLVGSNLAWCHPILYQRIAAAKERRPEMKIVVIDPRKTATCDLADLHLAIAPGADVALFNGLVAHLEKNNKVDRNFVADHTSGYQAALEAASTHNLNEISELTNLSLQQITEFYESFANTERTVTVYSQGVNQSTSGTDKVNAIISCHLITGRIGKPGMGPFSVTGQPNAMGGREVGGLSNQLANHLALENPEHRTVLKAFWQSPTMASQPGLKAVDMFQAVADGDIKAIWIMGTNPVDSLPEADKVRKALQSCPCVVVSDVVAQNDTTACADVVLPAAAWGEKDGTVTNSERRISRQRSFLPLPGAAKPDWWIISNVAKRMGFAEAFAYEGPHDIFNEYALSTTVKTSDQRDLDLSGLASEDAATFEDLSPVQWPVPQDESGTSSQRLFADGNFFTPDSKARIVATPFRPPESKTSKSYPLILNTGRIRDQWHTMTRTALSPRLTGHIGEPFAELHPRDAEKLAISPTTLVEVKSKHGTAIVRAAVSDCQYGGSVFVPMHWTDQFASKARIDSVVSAETDPVSGQPESKFTPVSVTPWPAKWYGYAVLAERPASVSAEYWAIAQAQGGWCLELAGLEVPDDWRAYAHALFGAPQTATEQTNTDGLLAYSDQSLGQYRFVDFNGAALRGALFIAPTPVEVSRSWARDLLSQEFGEPEQRLRLLAARAGADQPNRGAIVCSCFSVGVNQITDAVCAGGCESLDDIGVQLQAGTNCGSCRPEIRKLIDETRLSQAS